MKLQTELGLQNPFKDIRHEMVLNVVRTANVVSARLAQLVRRFGLTEAQFNALFALRYGGGPVTQVELGKRLVVTRASTTSVLDKLESKGLIRRVNVPGNRRIHHVELTGDGTALIERVEPVYREEIQDALGGFGDAECAQLILFMEQAREGVQRLLNANGKGSGSTDSEEETSPASATVS